MNSCERPSKSSARDLVPSAVSKLYSFSTGIQGMPVIRATNGEIRERRVIDNRVFLLGLDALYRGAMKQNEGVELLRCAREVAWSLHVAPANVPVEGYYA